MKTLIKRLYAGLCDALFVGLPVGIVYYIFIWQNAQNADFKISYQELNFNLTYATMMLLFIYYIVCEIIGQSVGKKIFNLKITYKGKGVFAKILRPFLKIITLYFWPIAVLSVFLPNHLLLYDYILKTNIEEVGIK